MKSPMELLRCLLNELSKWCCASTARDLERITSRVEHEGFSFLTITLPAFGKDFEKSLDRGLVDSTVFAGYAKTGCLPRFLSGFTSQVFSPKTGCLLDTPSIDAIHAVRQLTQLFAKVELPCSDARVAAAFEKYVECDKEIGELSFSALKLREFENVAHVLFHDVFLQMDFSVLEGTLMPKHGPGATADKLRGNAKWNQRVWHDRLEEYFPSGEYLYPSLRHYDVDEVTFLGPELEPPVRVITVPKTLKTPRIIAIEPTCMQYTQQALLGEYVGLIEKDSLLNQFLGFRDQVPNQVMARKGSKEGSLATLDLSEASDRVSNQLVLTMMKRYPLFSGAAQACRSTHADVPGHGVLPLAKFASMGSALCFPIEASVFLTIVMLGISRQAGPVTPRLLRSLRGRVRIYGDDIVVPVEYARSVVGELESFGLVVNRSKSFWTGKFRESCGKEFYDGHDVSVVKVRAEFPTQRRHASEVESLASLRNQLYFAGLWETAAYIDGYISRIIPWPVVATTSPAIGRHSFLGYETQRECPRLQRSMVYAARLSSRTPRSDLDGSDAMLKCFLNMTGEEPVLSKDHLERAGRPRAVDIKLGWCCSH